ncbi:MAG: hypothetical protein ACYDIE_10720 [Candidatus Krumholzibacteriia bacterium]
MSLAALGLVQAWARTPALTALGAALLLVSLWPFYFPTRWRLDGAGVAADYGLWHRRWAWERFRAFVPLRGAVVLTPFVRPHPLERWRAVLVPCPEDGDRLAALLAGRLARRDRRPGGDA